MAHEILLFFFFVVVVVFFIFMIAGILVGQLLFILNLKKSHPIDTGDQVLKIG